MLNENKISQRLQCLLESGFFGNKPNKELNENFFRWFNGSKVVNSDGSPKVMYHGSINNFKEFDIKHIGTSSGNYGHYGYGFYFSDNKSEASVYGDVIECYLKITNPFRGTPEEIKMLKKYNVGKIDDIEKISITFESLVKAIQKIDPVAFEFLNYISKEGYERAFEIMFKKYDNKIPTKIDLDDLYDIVNFSDYNENVDGIPDYFEELVSSIGINPNDLEYNEGFLIEPSLHWVTDLGGLSKEVTDAIIDLGYDGVIYGSENVAFYSNQIKAVNNDGSWDINDNNIYS